MHIRPLLLIAMVNLVIGSPYYEIQQLLGRKRTWSSQIKNCISSCKRILYKCHKDMNYCIEGCRIRVYKPIYYCVYEQCNNRGLGVNETFHPVKYHQCVHLCKMRPKKNITDSNRSSGYRTTFLHDLHANLTSHPLSDKPPVLRNK